MKNSSLASPSFRLLGVAFVAAACLFRAYAADADANLATVPFSKPDAPRALRVETMWADVRITGADVDQVTVRSSARAAEHSTRRADGLRIIAGSSTFDLSERDNTVYLTQHASTPSGHNGGFDITVPRNTSVVVKIATNGDASVKDVTGDIEVSALNGSVRLEGAAGGVAVDSMNGEISARYATLPDGKTHSFSSMNGQIRIFVPGDAKATFRLRAQNGTVATDFDEKVFTTKSEAYRGGSSVISDAMRMGMDAARIGMEAAREALEEARESTRESLESVRESTAPEAPEAGLAPNAPKPPKAPRAHKAPHRPTFPAFGGQVVTGTLNGGGVEIRATTMNGEIQVREGK